MNNRIEPCFIVLAIAIVALAVAVFFYIKYTNKKMLSQFKKEKEDLKESLEASHENMLRNISSFFETGDSNILSREAMYKKHHEELLNTFQKLGLIIKDDLAKTMSDTGACRVALYLLHNGQRSSLGIDFVKVSCVGEKILIGSGVKEQIINHSNLPLNIFDNMLEKLIENGRYIVMNDSETMATARAQFISSPKIKYAQEVAIYDSGNNILGFILAEYDHIYNKPISDTEFAAIKELAIRIAPILSFSDYIELTLNE